jgi:hypothetical protein
VPLLLRKLVLGIPAQANNKKYAAAIAFGAPIRPTLPVPTPPWVGTSLRNDFTPCSEALQVCDAALCKPARNYGYWGLKIFASLGSASRIFSEFGWADRAPFGAFEFAGGFVVPVAAALFPSAPVPNADVVGLGEEPCAMAAGIA